MKYRSLLLAGAAFQVGSVHAIGLGNMEVESYLGAPLQARIDLVAEQELSEEEVKISLADADIYTRFGARDLVDHGRLQFDVFKNAQGQLSARVISSRRIVEPYIDMVVELRWPQGVAYRQYQVLLDLPQQTSHLQAALHPVSKQPKLELPSAIVKAAQPASRPAVKQQPQATEQAPAQQRSTTQASAPVQKQLASKPEDEINELRAQLLRLRRERAALLAHRNAISTELQSLKEVQVLLAEQESTPKVAVSDPVSLSANLPTATTIPAISVPAISDPEISPSTFSLLTSQIDVESGQQLMGPLAASIGLPVSGDTLITHYSAQEIINRESEVVTESQEGGRSGIGLWLLVTLLPLVFLMAFFLMRARLVQRTKSSDSVKDEDLYELIFGGQRDRNRVENKEQVGKALQQIKAKATLYQFSGNKKDAIIVREDEDFGVDLEALLAQVAWPEEENDWMVDAPIRHMVR